MGKRCRQTAGWVLALCLYPLVVPAEAPAAGQAPAAATPYQDLVDAMNAGRGTGPCRIPSSLPQGGPVTLTSGKYQLVLNAGSAFTIGEIRYGDARISTPAGAHGTVILTKQANETLHRKDSQGDPWIGTAHGGEIVHAVTCSVDGKEQPLTRGATLAGNRIVVEKTQTLYKFRGKSTLVLTPDGFEERQDLQAMEAVAELERLYLFMHPWVPTTATWLAGYGDGREEAGEFGTDRSIWLGAGRSSQPRWFALYDPTLKLGMFQLTREDIPGTSLIQVRDRYHKHYTVLPTRGRRFDAGESLSYSMCVRVVENENGDWTATRAAVKALARP